jgi:MoxR-like ATPase
MQGRMQLSIADIQAIAVSVLRHRIIPNFDAHADGETPDTVLKEILRTVTAAAA